MAETQFSYLQTTSLEDRRHPRRIQLADVNVTTTEAMKSHKFEAPEPRPNPESQGMPETEELDSSTDIQKYVVRLLNELNFKGRFYHPNRRSAIQKYAWKEFNKGTLVDDKGNPVTNKRDVWMLIQTRQFMATLPKLALEMTKAHLVLRKAGIQVQWFFPGQNNLSRLLKTTLAFNKRITKVR